MVIQKSYSLMLTNSLICTTKQQPYYMVNDGYYMVMKWLMVVNNSLVGGIPTPLKNTSLSVGVMNFQTEWKIKAMFQTTNQSSIL